MPRFFSTSDPVVNRVSAMLAIVATAFLSLTWYLPEPWKRDSLKKMAKRLEVDKSEVPWQAFFDFETMGGQNLGVDLYRQIGLWQGALLVGVILAICALTVRWWLPLTRLRPRPASWLQGVPPEPVSVFRAGRVGWISLGVILVVAGFLRVPHLDRSLYFDEQDNLRRNFHGYLEIRPDGEEGWKGAGWSEALWENKLGNNPVMLSVLAQASLRTWRAITGTDRQRFSVVALRMPVLLAGLASIAALWWLLQVWGLPWAAGIAAGLAAIHPMHIDYSLQARGYALVLLFVPLALMFAWLALRDNRWRSWFGLAFCVFFCLWSYAGSVYFALTLNVGLLSFLLWRGLRFRDSGMIGPISRMMAVNAVTGLLYVFLIFPHLPQVSYHFRQVFEMIPMEAFWVFYAWSHYSTGTNFPAAQDIYDLRTDAVTLQQLLLQRFASAEPVLVLMQWLLIPVLMIVGLFWLWRRSRKEGLSPALMVLVVALFSPVLALIHQHFTSLYFYYWYLSYALPLVIAAMAMGLQAVIDPLLKRDTGVCRSLAITVCAIFFALFAWQTGSWTGRSGRIPRDVPWPVNDEGVAQVEFRRGRSLWIATQDGRSIRMRDVYDAEGRQRAGR
ncbi:MAG: hypothetical protein L3J39_16845 [Verrucomicrobiales bacterium]|nr:hypothetical protein [Verrucomicrobiales bacterium]